MPDFNFSDGLSEDWVSQPGSTAPKSSRPSINVLRTDYARGATPSDTPSSLAHDSLKRALSERSPSQLNTSNSHASTPSGTMQRNEAGKKPETFLWKTDKATPQDLFSATTGLERMFKPPTLNAHGAARLGKSVLSPLKDDSEFPSSPPILPPSRTQTDPKSSQRRKSSLPIRTGAFQSGGLPSIREAPGDTKTSRGLSTRRGSNASRVHSLRSVFEQESNEHPQAIGSRVSSRNTNESFSMIDPKFVRLNRASINAASRSLQKKMDTRGISEQERPSSRHSDDGVDYGSNQRDRRATRKSSGASSNAQSRADDGSANADAVGEAPHFVTLRRGGFSSDDSFRRRPLSPSSFQLLSTPTLPEAPRHSSQLPQTKLGSKDLPSTPSQNALPSPARAAQSPGSPLKLFEQYDTFTKDHLTRRISQFQINKSAFGDKANEGDVRESFSDSELGAGMNDDFGNGTLDTFTFTHHHPTPNILGRIDKSGIPSAGRGHSTQGQKHRSSGPIERRGSRTVSIRRPSASRKPESAIKIGKRQQRSPQKEPEPKRLRTINRSVSWGLAGRPRLQGSRASSLDSIAGKKRRDAKYDDLKEDADLEAVAERRRLHPRPYLESQRSSSRLARKAGKEAEPPSQAKKGGIRVVEPSLIDATSSPEAPAGGAAFGRKRSVTTADFCKEAKQVMQSLRQRVQPLEALAQTHASSDLRPLPEEASEPFTRPPSREYSTSQKPEQEEVESVIIHHLHTFKDTDDLGLALDSSIKPRRRNSEGSVTIDLPESDPPNMRILEKPRSHSDGEVGGADTQAIRHDSQKSLASNAHTSGSIPTRSSGSSGHKTTISPDKVSHLISENVGKMTFDPHKLRWVKKVSPKNKEGHVSSDPSEEDPLQAIPDLLVDDNADSESMPRTIEQDLVGGNYEEANVAESVQHTRDAPGHSADKGNSEGSVVHKTISKRTVSAASQSRPKLGQDRDSVTQAKVGPSNDKHEETKASGKQKPNTFHPVKARATSKANRSVMFSSPPEVIRTASEQKPSSRSRISSIAAIPEKKRLSSLNFIASNDPIIEEQEISTQVEQDMSLIRAGSSPESIHPYPPSRSIELVPIPENGERTVAKAAPLRTPPRPQDLLRVALNSSVGFHLSPLPSFTVHQADESLNLDVDYVAKRQGLLAFPVINEKFSMAVEKLVGKIADVEPSEPFWEYIRKLNLVDKGIFTLHMLDEFCPRIEELDVGSNELGQINGAPSGLRVLSVRQNCLSSLTAWGHLQNLQYLDVSGNQIESLKAFSPLIHLRELVAEDNQIESLDGVLELNGLLTLRLANNSIKKLELDGSDLYRLVELNCGENEIRQVSGLDSVPALKQLKLSGNSIKDFPSDSSGNRSLARLDLSRNELETIDISHMRDLRFLNLDENRIVSIQGLGSHDAIQLSWRNQRLDCSIDPFQAKSNLCRDTWSLAISSNKIPRFTPRQPLWGLRRLEVAHSGIRDLDEKFGQMMPNLRALNLNHNGIKHLDALIGLRGLEELHVAGNRLHRLRRTAAVIRMIGQNLRVLDCRDNPITIGYYAPASARPSASKALTQRTSDPSGSGNVETMQHLLAPEDESTDEQHLQTLDKSTLLRRQVYEILMLVSGGLLTNLDGLAVNRARVGQSQPLIRRLQGLGVLHKQGQMQKSTSYKEIDTAHDRDNAGAQRDDDPDATISDGVYDERTEEFGSGSDTDCTIEVSSIH